MRLFDEWGNFAGDYIPAGGGLDSCLMTIAMTIAFGFFFLVYYFFKLIVEGVKALVAKDYDKATSYLIVPVLVIVFAVIFAAGSAHQDKLSKEYYEQYQIDFQAGLIRQKEELEGNPPFEIRAWKGECKNHSGYYCPHEGVLFIIIEVTNNYEFSAGIDAITYPPPGGSYVTHYIDPGETERQYYEPDNIEDAHKVCVKVGLDLPWDLRYHLSDDPVTIPPVCIDI